MATPVGSETEEQRQYERQLHERQAGDVSSEELAAADMTTHTQPDEKTKKPGFFKRHSSAFYHRVVKPAFPEAIADLKLLASMTALETRVKHEIKDTKLFPEIEHVAEVRRGLELCAEEQAFRHKRLLRVRDHFAAYMGVGAEDVHPDDVPVIAFGGSGGGARAMLGTLGYCQEMKTAGLWDCLSYVAGVSGSCWSLAAYYTIGRSSMQAVIDHCKIRLNPHHPLSGEAIRILLGAPGGAKSTLGPLIQKSTSGLATVAMDLYSVFITGWLFHEHVPLTDLSESTPQETSGVEHRSWYKLSSARQYTDDGSEPMPIITAIRHERPWKDWHDARFPFKEPDHSKGDHAEASEAWFQWFEFTPYEAGCDEIEAWVPIWGFGRPFSGGKSTMQLPEQSLALLLGLATSAPAGPLTSYLSTISRNLPSGFLGNSIHKLANAIAKFWGKDDTEEFQNHHPLHACNEHNFMYDLSPTKPGHKREPGLENSPRLHLIDSGMDNNCPTYVLLHPHREVDVMITMDASSDVQKDKFQERVDQIGGRRGLRFTKRGERSDAEDRTQVKNQYAQIYDGVPCRRPETVVDSYGRTVCNPPAPTYDRECTMIYMPLLPNEAAVPDFDPSTATFSGSYNLVWTKEQVEMLVKVSQANFQDGQDEIKDVLREAWQRRKAERERVGAATAS